MIIPPFGKLTFYYAGICTCSIPVFVLVLLAKEQCKTPEHNRLLEDLDVWSDRIANPRPGDQRLKSPEVYVDFLKQTISWHVLAPYLPIPSYLRDAIGEVWSEKNKAQGAISIGFEGIDEPATLYRYMPFHPDRMHELFAEGKLFMPCPAKFNDPFDCSLDEPIRLSFIERAIGCFSAVADNVLMFSHYADNHGGLCIGFNARQLLRSLTEKNQPLHADLRPVWYFSKMPLLSHISQPALCATCKHDIWSYEQEFRIFMANGSSLAPSGLFAFDRGAITEVICGCKATDDTVAVCKKLTNDLASCEHKKAFQMPNQFGVQLRTIHKV